MNKSQKEDDSSGSDSDDLFKIRRAPPQDRHINELDSSRIVYDPGELEHDWTHEDARERIRYRFVTGEWIREQERLANSDDDTPIGEDGNGGADGEFVVQ